MSVWPSEADTLLRSGSVGSGPVADVAACESECVKGQELTLQFAGPTPDIAVVWLTSPNDLDYEDAGTARPRVR